MNKFGISVTTPEQSQDESFGTDSWVACQLHGEGRPDSITLHIEAVEENVTSLSIHNARARTVEGKLNFDLSTPVTWGNDEWRGLLPHTREKGKDNVDIILVDASLHFRNVQISLLVRKGRFYIMTQRIFEGWMRMEDRDVRFVPSDATHAYPGMDYPKLLGREGLDAMTKLAQRSEILEDAMLSAATWDPSSPTEQNGWRRGNVLWFNPIINGGRIRGIDDGKEYHIFGNNLVDVDGPIKMLKPMAEVYYRPNEKEEGLAKSCKLA